jgi:hypothetical protein
MLRAYKDKSRKKFPCLTLIGGLLGRTGIPIWVYRAPGHGKNIPKTKTIMVKFLVIHRPLSNNAILGRIALNELKAVKLTPHLSKKFPMEEGIGVQKGDQRIAREC